ncbi:MAG: glucose-1-phosphate adenylyltransferase, partial [Epulopiscium sp.]|nr:glucose-1-phosphate adenylyltransferase [Candidatus Epulonipiscium sp.]
HAVIFRRVYIGENSVVKDSIIMEGSYVGNHCVVQNAILDKNVVLSDGKQVIGTLEEPIIIKKGTVI